MNEELIAKPDNDCRMYVNPEDRGYDGMVCKALYVGCIGPKNCPFYRVEQEYQESLTVAYRRIKKLPFATQSYISQTYYKGKMPWLRVKDEPEQTQETQQEEAQ